MLQSLSRFAKPASWRMLRTTSSSIGLPSASTGIITMVSVSDREIISLSAACRGQSCLAVEARPPPGARTRARPRNSPQRLTGWPSFAPGVCDRVRSRASGVGGGVEVRMVARVADPQLRGDGLVRTGGEEPDGLVAHVVLELHLRPALRALAAWHVCHHLWYGHWGRCSHHRGR